jgi:putative endonuclease
VPGPIYFLYILECADGSLYTGITTDVDRRFREHLLGKGGHYTRSHGALKIVYREPCGDRSSALKREAAVKKLSRKNKEFLIHTSVASF